MLPDWLRRCLRHTLSARNNDVGKLNRREFRPVVLTAQSRRASTRCPASAAVRPLTGAAAAQRQFCDDERTAAALAVASTWTPGCRRLRRRGSHAARLERFYGPPDRTVETTGITGCGRPAKLFTTLARTRRQPSGVY